MMHTVTLERNRIREGLFIPKDMFIGHTSIEIKMANGNVMIVRPQERSLVEIRRSIDRRREAIKAQYGMLGDSTLLIREDRDSR